MEIRNCRGLALFSGVAILAAACQGTDTAERSGAATPSPRNTAALVSSVPAGTPLPAEEVRALAAMFDDQPYTGGQTAPRVSKWISPDTYLFLQFDKMPPSEASEIRYVGVGVKGVHCAEAQPDAQGKRFTHFHRPSAPEYQQGHAGEPGAQGYWLSWLAVDRFTARDGREVNPGIDYAFSPTEPPQCGAKVPSAEFAAPDEKRLSKQDLQGLAAFFDDQILRGGQVPPRLSKWLNQDVALFLQLDKPNISDATTVRYVGIYQRGVYCKSAQPSRDFTHFHRLTAADYRDGHAGEPGERAGFWLLWVAADSFTARDGRKVTPGVDREFSPTTPPDC